MTGFFGAGCVLMAERNGNFHSEKWDRIYHETDLSIVEINGVGNGKSAWVKLTGQIKKLKSASRVTPVDEPLLIFVQAPDVVFKEGDVLLVAAAVEPITNARNPGEFDAEYFWRTKGIEKMCFVQKEQFIFLQHHSPAWIIQKLDSLREGLVSILKNNLSGEELSIALALILGDKTLLDTEVKTSFTNTGAMHVLAVSGLHVGIIMQLLIYFLGLFNRFISRKTAVLAVVGVMWIYAILTGLSPSVLRAVIMFSILVLSQLSERTYSPLNALFLTGFVLCLWNPFTLFDIGFQLSFLAMLGIFLFYKPIEKTLYFDNRLLMKIWQGTAIGFAAQLMTTPLSLYYFHQFPNYFVLTNIGLMASSGIILGGGIFLFGISWFNPLAKLTAWVLTLSIFLSLAFIRWVEALPGAVAFGFEVGILFVLVSGILILAVFTLPLSRNARYTWYTSGLILLTVLVFQRYQNITKRELCILNARFPIVLFRDGEQLFCFHGADTEQSDKLHFAVDSYRKLYPGTVRYFSMDKNWSIQGKFKIEIQNKTEGKLISINGSNYLLKMKNTEQQSQGVTASIGMPWVYSAVNHSLRGGAFRKEL
jgi:competence protein ComEC